MKDKVIVRTEPIANYTVEHFDLVSYITEQEFKTFESEDDFLSMYKNRLARAIAEHLIEGDGMELQREYQVDKQGYLLSARVKLLKEES